MGVALAGTLALLVPAAVASTVGPYRFAGKVWNPKALPETPAVGGHPLTPASPIALTASKGRTAPRSYQVRTPSWPAAGSATLDLSRQTAARPLKAAGLPVWVAPASTAGKTAAGKTPTGRGTDRKAAGGKAAATTGAATGTPAVTVRVASHAQTLRAGANGMLIGVTPKAAPGTSGAAGSTGGGSSRVHVVVDYSALAKAYGGGYGSRLRLVQLPACALSTPELAACQKRTPLAFANRVGARQLTATVDLGTPAPAGAATPAHTSAMTTTTAAPAAAAATAMAGVALEVTSGSSGSQGDYTATALSQSGTWQTSATGSFTYSYPLDVPSAVGGDGPDVSLDYDSQSQDGETSARNSQSSWIGDGWSYQPGFVERSYRGCGTLLDSDGNKILKKSGDECWGGANAALSFGSHSGTLVPTSVDSSVTGEIRAWKLQGDDGTVVQELSGAANGLQDGTYFRVLTRDGTAAYFGAEHAPSGAGTSATMPASPSDSSTDSAWGVPVLHPVSGDPCYDSAKGKASRCDKPEGWRWNLDFVVSPTGFVQRYDYGTEKNYYDLGGGQAATGSDGTLVSYTRGGSLTSISYGYTLADEKAGRTPAAQVDFATSQRCQTTSTFTDCSAGNLNDTTAPHWPDVPWDLHCDSSDSTHLPTGSTTVPAGVCVTVAPTFFSTARLDSITTQVHVKDATTDKLVPVDSYQLGQVYSDAGGTVDPVTGTSVDPKDAGSLQAVMWLQSIRHTGKGTYGNGNSDIAVNQVSFTGTEIDNRVNDSSPSAPPLYHPRIASIQTETGEGVTVAYNQTPCAGLTLNASTADANTNSCYPVYWTVPGASKPIADWFNKVTVHQVTTSDLTIASQYTPDAQKLPAGSEAQVATYSYTGPAWHRDDSALTDDQYRTWDDFRGFRTVTVQSGQAPEPVTQATTTYLQGMDGDYKADGTRRTVAIPVKVGADTVETVTDTDNLAGAVLESDTWSAAGGHIVAETVNGPFTSTTTETAAQTPWTDWTQEDNPGDTRPALHTLPDLAAYRAKSVRTSDYDLLADGSWRHTQTDATYDAQGRMATVDEHGDVAVPAQEKCTSTAYATPGTSNTMMLDYADQTTVVSGPCAAPTASTLLSDRKVYYDADGTPGSLGTFGQLGQSGRAALGQVSAVRLATGWTGSTENWQTSTSMAYDGAGRVIDSYDITGQKTHTDYSPAWTSAGGNTNPVGITTYNPQQWKDTSALDPLRGLPTEDVDANGRVTDIAYDALGRRTAVWLPGRATTQSASMTFSYAVNPGAVPAPGDTITSPGAPSAVTTRTLREDGTYASSITLYDGMLQARQTQTTADSDSNSGRVITDTFYDSHGWPTASYAPYSEPTSLPGTTLFAADENEVPAETTNDYDGQGRALTTTVWHQAQPQWHTTTAYPGADETDSTGPVGGRSTATFTNALGQTTSSVVRNTGTTVQVAKGQTLPSGTSLASASVRLAMQADGNLVLSGLATGKTLWSSNTSGHPGAWATFGSDGNLVVYDTKQAVLWSSGTAGTGSVLQIQNDANLAVDNAAGAVAWSSGTAGQASTADATSRYTYWPSGQVASVKDTAGNTWSSTYDLLGRLTSQNDPNVGTTTFDKYDTAGNLLQMTDPRGQVLSYAYDWDNRVTAEYSGAWSATPDATKELASRVYDTLAKGYPTASTRYVGGATGTGSKAYTEAVTGYNTAYQPLGSSLTVPAADGFAAAGQTTAPTSGSVTYTTTSAYTPTVGLLSSTHYEADGKLPAEDVDFGYTQQDNLDSFGGFINNSNTPSYLDTTVHDPFGRVQQTNYGPTGKELATFAQYDATTGRTVQTSSMLQTSSTALDVVDYRYDQSGQLTAIDDLQNNTTHDTQCFSYDSFQRLTAAWTDTGGITDPTSAQPGAVGGCRNTSVQTTTTAPVRTTTVGGPAPYWQTYTYDLLGDRTGMVSHDTAGNALADTTQTTAYPGANGTTTATRPDEAQATTTANPATGTTTSTPGYTDPAHGNVDAGDTTSRKVTSTGPLVTAFTLSGGGTRCVEDASSSTTAGAKVQINTCGTAAGQKWSLGSDNTVRVQGLCLDTTANAVTAGTKIVIDTCSADATQKWKRTTTGTLVSAAAPTLCLTDPAASATNATQLTLATCGSAGQTWTDATTGATPAGQTQTFAYDAEGRTATVSTGNGTHTSGSSYLYDADGTLLEQTASTDGTATTRILYLFGGAEQITLNVAAKTFTGLRNYTGPDGTTITRSSSGSVTYQVGGLQGTATTAVDAGTLAVTRRFYDPYGNLRGARPGSWVAPDENHGFLGQPTDAATGLDLLGARNYDPVLGRFLTPDPLFQAGDPNQMGGYTYAADNPVNGSDPSGYDDWYNDPTMNVCVIDCNTGGGGGHHGGGGGGGHHGGGGGGGSAHSGGGSSHHHSSFLGKVGNFFKGVTNTVAEGINPDCYIAAVWSAAADYCNDVFNGDFKGTDSYKTGQIFTWIGTAGLGGWASEGSEAKAAEEGAAEEESAASGAKKAEKDGAKSKAPTAGSKAAAEAAGEGSPPTHDDWENDPSMNKPVSPSDVDTGVPGKTVKTRTPKKVYRGEYGKGRDAKHAFAEGFKAVPGKATLKDYVWWKHPANVVSTSLREGAAAGFTLNSKRGLWSGWMFEIHSPVPGIDVNASLGMKASVFSAEKEIAYLGEVEARYIYRARPYYGGKPSGPWEYNPGFEGPK